MSCFCWMSCWTSLTCQLRIHKTRAFEEWSNKNASIRRRTNPSTTRQTLRAHVATCLVPVGLILRNHEDALRLKWAAQAKGTTVQYITLWFILQHCQFGGPDVDWCVLIVSNSNLLSYTPCTHTSLLDPFSTPAWSELPCSCQGGYPVGTSGPSSEAPRLAEWKDGFSMPQLNTPTTTRSTLNETCSCGSRSKTHARLFSIRVTSADMDACFCCSGERPRKVRERSEYHYLYLCIRNMHMKTLS